LLQSFAVFLLFVAGGVTLFVVDNSRMRPFHILLAIAVVAVWGTNFVVIKLGLAELPPFLFAVLRFVCSALPWILFIKRPKVRWRWLMWFGVLLGAGQFGLLFYAMRADISPGLASLVVQMQVFFTIGLSLLIFRERVSALPLVGVLLAACGLMVIAAHIDATVTTTGIVAVVAAGFFWGCANMAVKRAAIESSAKVDMLGFVVWSSVFAIPPLVLLSLAFEGFDAGLQAVQHAHAAAWAAVLWQAIGNTLFGFAAWNWLLTRYPAAIVSPYALLVPLFGMGASALLLAEPLPLWKIAAALLVLGGLSIITVYPLLLRWAARD
jgi:O-acetylserine/cysteine efflux transporter